MNNNFLASKQSVTHGKLNKYLIIKYYNNFHSSYYKYLNNTIVEINILIVIIKTITWY